MEWLVIVLLVIILIQFIVHKNLINKLNNIEKRMTNIINIQGKHGNYNYDEYNLGLLNGMEVMIATYKQIKPIYIDGKKITFINSKSDKLQKKIDIALEILNKNRTRTEQRVYKVLKGEINEKL